MSHGRTRAAIEKARDKDYADTRKAFAKSDNVSELRERLQTLTHTVGANFDATLQFEGGVSSVGEGAKVSITHPEVIKTSLKVNDETAQRMSKALTLHESAHVRFTDMKAFVDAAKSRNNRGYFLVLNTGEDLRVEAETIADRPGTVADFEVLHDGTASRQKPNGDICYDFSRIVFLQLGKHYHGSARTAFKKQWGPVKERELDKLAKDFVAASQAARSTGDIVDLADRTFETLTSQPKSDAEPQEGTPQGQPTPSDNEGEGEAQKAPKQKGQKAEKAEAEEGDGDDADGEGEENDEEGSEGKKGSGDAEGESSAEEGDDAETQGEGEENDENDNSSDPMPEEELGRSSGGNGGSSVMATPDTDEDVAPDPMNYDINQNTMLPDAENIAEQNKAQEQLANATTLSYEEQGKSIAAAENRGGYHSGPVSFDLATSKFMRKAFSEWHGASDTFVTDERHYTRNTSRLNDPTIVQKGDPRVDSAIRMAKSALADALRQSRQMSHLTSKSGRVKATSAWKAEVLQSEKVFTKRDEHTVGSLAVTILLDASGSMGSGYTALIRPQAYVLAQALTDMGIPVAVLGHDTMGATNTNLHLYKDWEDKCEAIWNYHSGSSNRDGYAIVATARKYLLNRPEPNKILIVMSDGAPAANGGSDAWGKSKDYDPRYSPETVADNAKMVRWVRQRGIAVLGVYCGNDSQFLKTERGMYGNDFATVRAFEDFGKVVLNYLRRRIMEVAR